MNATEKRTAILAELDAVAASIVTTQQRLDDAVAARDRAKIPGTELAAIEARLAAAIEAELVGEVAVEQRSTLQKMVEKARRAVDETAADLRGAEQAITRLTQARDDGKARAASLRQALAENAVERVRESLDALAADRLSSVSPHLAWYRELVAHAIAHDTLTVAPPHRALQIGLPTVLEFPAPAASAFAGMPTRFDLTAVIEERAKEIIAEARA